MKLFTNLTSLILTIFLITGCSMAGHKSYFMFSPNAYDKIISSENKKISILLINTELTDARTRKVDLTLNSAERYEQGLFYINPKEQERYEGVSELHKKIIDDLKNGEYISDSYYVDNKMSSISQDLERSGVTFEYNPNCLNRFDFDKYYNLKSELTDSYYDVLPKRLFKQKHFIQDLSGCHKLSDSEITIITTSNLTAFNDSNDFYKDKSFIEKQKKLYADSYGFSDMIGSLTSRYVVTDSSGEILYIGFSTDAIKGGRDILEHYKNAVRTIFRFVEWSKGLNPENE